MALKRIHHVGVAVSDLARARRLLGETLGLPLVRESDGGNPSVAFYRCGEVEIELLEYQRPEDRAASLDGDRLGRIDHIAIEVDDLAATVQALEALGVTAGAPWQGLLGSSVRTSPETTMGVVLQLLEPAPGA